ncbi:hypothetical protein K402DRAFT_416876 [Aulographum hederae CBS 113979]|uniref:Uncharacterized protein n=1 Tax=Aulographum hederae CBS 113979 TaxID=1176131 RepID=A0A6G1HEE4_9PEZI|nr:hypothetical protein K402DRAFT_416876 [Aulographum hederae CBS 113979]
MAASAPSSGFHSSSSFSTVDSQSLLMANIHSLLPPIISSVYAAATADSTINPASMANQAASDLQHQLTALPTTSSPSSSFSSTPSTTLPSGAIVSTIVLVMPNGTLQTSEVAIMPWVPTTASASSHATGSGWNSTTLPATTISMAGSGTGGLLTSTTASSESSSSAETTSQPSDPPSAGVKVGVKKIWVGLMIAELEGT